MVKPNSENLSFWRKKCTPKSKNHILHIEAERVKAELVQELEENRRLKALVASYEGVTAKERKEHLWEN